MGDCQKDDAWNTKSVTEMTTGNLIINEKVRRIIASIRMKKLDLLTARRLDSSEPTFNTQPVQQGRMA